MSDQVQDSSAKITLERLRKGEVSLRLILPESYVPRYAQAIRGVEDRIEIRYLPEVPLGVGVTGKHAFVSFLTIARKIDYTGFTGEESAFIKWAQDMYLYEWELAKSRKPSSSLTT